MVYVDGWRGRIGLITIAAGSSTESEFNRYTPEGVAVLTTRVPLGGISNKALVALMPYVDEAAAMLASAEVDIIVFACTAGSLVKGVGYDQEIIARLKDLTGLPATTTTTGVVDGLRRLDVKKLVLTTPYSPEVNDAEIAFLKAAGFEVVSFKSLELDHPRLVPQIRPEEMYQLTRNVYLDEADGVFISCTGLHVDTIIRNLENDFKKPVITSNQATLWSALRKIGINDKIAGLGTLFEL